MARLTLLILDYYHITMSVFVYVLMFVVDGATVLCAGIVDLPEYKIMDTLPKYKAKKLKTVVPKLGSTGLDLLNVIHTIPIVPSASPLSISCDVMSWVM
jgi:hypothetical protein